MRSAWALRGVLLALTGVLGWILFEGGTGGAAFGVLAAGGWGLGLIPVHAKAADGDERPGRPRQRARRR
ncbi:hypothetical protein [Kitasatospora terrestris]|uniref:DUF2892 domain-containing protein n=1 Tax=Kitasatospora terrestris TaxID=258051 RepID=A0ABP9E5I6_9ACTN